MARHPLGHAVFIACMLTAFAGSAEAAIVQCIDQTGAVTFTDMPCKPGTTTVRASDWSDTAPAGINALPQGKGPVASPDNPVAHRRLTPDEATVKAAKDSMMSIDRDHALALERKQSLAQL